MTRSQGTQAKDRRTIAAAPVVGTQEAEGPRLEGGIAGRPGRVTG